MEERLVRFEPIQALASPYLAGPVSLVVGRTRLSVFPVTTHDVDIRFLTEFVVLRPVIALRYTVRCGLVLVAVRVSPPLSFQYDITTDIKMQVSTQKNGKRKKGLEVPL